ncbi:MAG: phosphoribosylaminoimidazolesuccinocarboxamide synthase [Bacillota bacterium]
MTGRPVVNLSGYKNPDYVGSVQELYYLKENPDWMLCQTTPGGSVFDVGTIFSIPQSDICRTAVRHKIYSLLGSAGEWRAVSDQIRDAYAGNKEYLQFLCAGILEEFKANGANTHHIGMVDGDTGEVYSNAFPPNPSQYVVVKRYKVIKPGRVTYFSKNLWDYSGYCSQDKYVIPLENIVRFGITTGSSIYKKYLSKNENEKRTYLDELGLKEELAPWTMFANPIVDFTTKYEPEDRNLSLQEAFYISGCGGEMFKNIIRMSILGSFLVHRFFAQLGLNLWDLKWEIAKDGNRLVFVDTIDTDSIRVTAKIEYRNRFYFVNFNKQSMRDYYKIIHSRWFEAVQSAKSEAARSGKSFLEHLRAGQEEGYYPGTPEVDERFISIQEEKFSALIAYIYGRATGGETMEALRLTGQKEIQYYESNNVLDQFAKLNGII